MNLRRTERRRPDRRRFVPEFKAVAPQLGSEPQRGQHRTQFSRRVEPDMPFVSEFEI